MPVIEVDMRGPMLDGRGLSILADICEEVEFEIAGQGLADVQYNLDRSIKHPTPYYETQIRVRNAGTSHIVDDRGVIYGPWLEGISERNQTTRFKGYASFRRAAQGLQAKTEPLATAVIRRNLGRLS